jgi:hypothetical protein
MYALSTEVTGAHSISVSIIARIFQILQKKYRDRNHRLKKHCLTSYQSDLIARPKKKEGGDNE